MRCFEVRKDDLKTIRWTEQALALPAGGIRCAIDIAALTANNVTYAVVADKFGYWNYYPAADGWGRVPVWGFATVTQSDNATIETGERIYGYWPIADEAVLEPGPPTERSFSDVSEHRRGLPQVYNDYQRVSSSRYYDPSKEAIRALFDPLAGTSYGVAHALASSGYDGARLVVITSASSKTAFSIAVYLKEQDQAIRILGLTSAGNLEATRGMGIYDEVRAYDHADEIEAGTPTIVADVAGNGDLMARLHARLGDSLRSIVTVGAAHPTADRTEDGPLATLSRTFFLPDYIRDRLAEGDKGFVREMVAASARLGDRAEPWMTLVEASGQDEIATLWHRVRAGDMSPTEGGILRLSGLSG